MKFGYARVSTDTQNLDLQIDALKNAGCDRIFEEIISTKQKKKVQLETLLAQLRSGDSLVVWKLDRLGRNVKELIELVQSLKDMKVNFISLQDNIDTSTAQGEFIFHILCSIAQMERDVISERTVAGLEAARARGRRGGRKAIDKATIAKAIKMYESGAFSNKEIEETCAISHSSLYKYIRLHRKEKSESQD